MRPRIPSRTTSVPLPPTRTASANTPENCNPGTVVVHDCDIVPAQKPVDDGFVSRVYTMSVRNVAFATTIVLPVPITRVLGIVIGWWIGLLLIVKSSLENVEEGREGGRVEEIEMVEGVGRGAKDRTRDGLEVECAEDGETSKSASSSSSGECCDSCEGSTDTIVLKPGGGETDTRSSTWDSIEQAKARRVLGFGSESSGGEEKRDEASGEGGEHSTRSTTWGSSKALKILGFERVNSRLISAMAADLEDVPDDPPSSWSRTVSCDLKEQAEYTALQELKRPEQAKLEDANPLRNRKQGSRPDHPVFSTVFVKAKDFPAGEDGPATSGVAEPTPIPIVQSIAKVTESPDAEDPKISDASPPRWPLRPAAPRIQTAPGAPARRSLRISSDEPGPSHQVTPEIERSRRRRASSAAQFSQGPLAAHLPRRTSSLVFAQAPSKPLVPGPPLPESEADDRMVMDRMERPHHHRFWSRFKEELREMGSSEDLRKRFKGTEEERGGRKEGSKGLRLKQSGA